MAYTDAHRATLPIGPSNSKFAYVRWKISDLRKLHPFHLLLEPHDGMDDGDASKLVGERQRTKESGAL